MPFYIVAAIRVTTQSSALSIEVYYLAMICHKEFREVKTTSLSRLHGYLSQHVVPIQRNSSTPTIKDIEEDWMRTFR